MKASTMKIINLVFLVIGVALFTVLLVRLDLREVGERLAAVGWVFLLSLACHTGTLMASSAAWQAVIHAERSRARYRLLLGAFWFGHAVNYVTPTGTAGEVLRGTVLKGRVEGSELVASIISYNLLNTASMAVFNLVGPLLCLLALQLPLKVVLSILVAAVLALVPLLLILVVLRLGAIKQLARLVGHLPLLRRFQQTLTEKATTIDRCIVEFTQRRGAFRRTVGWMFVARLIAPLEVWALLHVFLPEIGAWQLLVIAFVTQTTSQLLSWVINVVPGQIGFAEGGMTLLFELLGLDPLAGFSMELVRRLRMVVVVAIGLTIGFFLVRSSGSETPAPSADESAAEP